MSRPTVADRKASGAEFKALMERYGLHNVKGADKAAAILYCTRQTILQYYSRGLRRTEFELLELRLKDMPWGEVDMDAGTITLTAIRPAYMAK